MCPFGCFGSLWLLQFPYLWTSALRPNKNNTSSFQEIDLKKAYTCHTPTKLPWRLIQETNFWQGCLLTQKVFNSLYKSRGSKTLYTKCHATSRKEQKKVNFQLNIRNRLLKCLLRRTISPWQCKRWTEVFSVIKKTSTFFSIDRLN